MGFGAVYSGVVVVVLHHEAQALRDSLILSSALCLYFIFSLDSSRWQGGKGSPFSVPCVGHSSTGQTG